MATLVTATVPFAVNHLYCLQDPSCYIYQVLHTTPMLNEYCAVAVSSEAKDGEALDGFIDGRTAIAQYGKCTYLQRLT